MSSKLLGIATGKNIERGPNNLDILINLRNMMDLLKMSIKLS